MGMYRDNDRRVANSTAKPVSWMTWWCCVAAAIFGPVIALAVIGGVITATTGYKHRQLVERAESVVKQCRVNELHENNFTIEEHYNGSVAKMLSRNCKPEQDALDELKRAEAEPTTSGLGRRIANRQASRRGKVRLDR